MKGILALLFALAGLGAARVCLARPAGVAADAAAREAGPQDLQEEEEAGVRRPAEEELVRRRIRLLVDREPTIDQVRGAAVRYAGLAPDRAGAWARRSRLAGLAPELSARVLRAVGRDEGVKLSGGEADYQKIDAGDDLILEVRATWDLSRLVFDGAELRAARESARQAAQRRQLESEVTRLYYERRRSQIEWILDPPSGATETARRSIEMEELTAQLDALTGGYLSREIVRMTEE